MKTTNQSAFKCDVCGAIYEDSHACRSQNDVAHQTYTASGHFALGLKDTKAQTSQRADRPSLTCERCGNKTDGGAWLGFVYVGAECLTESDNEYLE